MTTRQAIDHIIENWEDDPKQRTRVIHQVLHGNLQLDELYSRYQFNSGINRHKNDIRDTLDAFRTRKFKQRERQDER